MAAVACLGHRAPRRRSADLQRVGPARPAGAAVSSTLRRSRCLSLPRQQRQHIGRIAPRPARHHPAGVARRGQRRTEAGALLGLPCAGPAAAAVPAAPLPQCHAPHPARLSRTATRRRGRAGVNRGARRRNCASRPAPPMRPGPPQVTTQGPHRLFRSVAFLFTCPLPWLFSPPPPFHGFSVRLPRSAAFQSASSVPWLFFVRLPRSVAFLSASPVPWLFCPGPA